MDFYQSPLRLFKTLYLVKTRILWPFRVPKASMSFLRVIQARIPVGSLVKEWEGEHSEGSSGHLPWVGDAQLSICAGSIEHVCVCIFSQWPRDLTDVQSQSLQSPQVSRCLICLLFPLVPIWAELRGPSLDLCPGRSWLVELTSYLAAFRDRACLKADIISHACWQGINKGGVRTSSHNKRTDWEAAESHTPWPHSSASQSSRELELVLGYSRWQNSTCSVPRPEWWAQTVPRKAGLV